MDPALRGGELTAATVPRRLLPAAVAAVFLAPVIAGLAGTILPALGIAPPAGGGDGASDALLRLAATPGILRSALLSLATGLVATALALAAVAAFFAAFAGTPVLGRIQHLVSPLLSVPHAAAAYALAFLVAPSGLLLRLVSPALTGFERPPDWLIVNDPLGLALVLGLAAKEMPFLFLMALATLSQLPLRAGRNLAAGFGYGRMAGFLVTLWPGLYRRIRLPVFAVLAYATSVADVATILGPDLPPTLSVRITEWMADPDLSLRGLASAAALLQIGVTLAAMALWLCLERLGSALLRRSGEAGLRFSADGPARIVAALAVSLPAMAIGLGIAGLGLWSVAGLWPFPDLLPESLALKIWLRQAPALADLLATTLAIGLAAAALGLAVAVLLLALPGSRQRDAPSIRFLYLSLLVPQVSFVFGLHVFTLVLDLRPSIALMVAVHLVFVLPYMLLSLADPWRALDPRYERIAAGLGVGTVKTLFLIRLPLLTRPLLTAFAVGFAVSVGLYLPTLIVGGGRFATITTEAVALSAGGDRRVIGVYALVQALLPFLGFAIAFAVPRLLFRGRRRMRI
ncbi:ABC transporter permease [Rhizobium sp. TRM95111]|uniref:ABC transporter permease n=1 Tax=Rhizobium alarense TaxID=2846851 RepID=UPI001F1F5E6C|nr:ABC transporter permease [Rhizobium alarense]MCF3642314.1 ABC transporter permease [Rhizobium alarense]